MHVELQLQFNIQLCLHFNGHKLENQTLFTHLKSKTLHEPLVSQEVAGHVDVSIIDKSSHSGGQELVLRPHGGVLTLVSEVHLVTETKSYL